jgi:hypothetical protein
MGGNGELKCGRPSAALRVDNPPFAKNRKGWATQLWRFEKQIPPLKSALVG